MSSEATLPDANLWLALFLDGHVHHAAARRWLVAHAIVTLNVAGPRESKLPGIYGDAAHFLRRLLG